MNRIHLVQIQVNAAAILANSLTSGSNMALLTVAFFDDRGYLYLPEVSKTPTLKKMLDFDWK